MRSVRLDRSHVPRRRHLRAKHQGRDDTAIPSPYQWNTITSASGSQALLGQARARLTATPRRVAHPRPQGEHQRLPRAQPCQRSPWGRRRHSGTAYQGLTAPRPSARVARPASTRGAHQSFGGRKYHVDSVNEKPPGGPWLRNSMPMPGSRSGSDGTQLPPTHV